MVVVLVVIGAVGVSSGSRSGGSSSGRSYHYSQFLPLHHQEEYHCGCHAFYISFHNVRRATMTTATTVQLVMMMLLCLR